MKNTQILKNTTILLVIILYVFLFVTQNAYTKIKVTSGSSEKKTRLIQMMQNASFTVFPPAGFVNYDTLTGSVTMIGNPSTFFGQTLKKIINDTGNIELSLDKSINGQPVFIGAFNGGINSNGPANGMQSLDINDFNKLDSVGQLGVGSWVSFLIHELVEQYIGWKYSLNYSQAHDSALTAENEQIFRIGGQRYKRENDLLEGDTIVLIYKKDGTNERIGIRFSLGEYGQVQNSSSGFIDDLKIKHISGGCSSGLCGFTESSSGIMYEPLAGSEPLAGAEYLISDRNGNIYASLPIQSKVLRMNKYGKIDREYVHNSLSYPSGLAYNPVSEELFVACRELNHIVVFDVNGYFKRILSIPGLDMIAGMDMDPEGNLYVSSHGSDSVIQISAFGDVIKRIGNPELRGPAGIVYADGLDRFYVVSNTNNKILMFNKNGSYLGQFGNGVSLSSPWGLSISGGKFDRIFPVGTVYTPMERLAVTNAGTNGIIVFNPDGSIKSNLSYPGFQPKAMLITQYLSFSPIGINPVISSVPEEFHLHQNYPNPFNPVTNIKFVISGNEHVNLTIYDALGKEIIELINENLKPGEYNIKWNASECPSGVYFYRLSSGKFSDTKKMVLVK